MDDAQRDLEQEVRDLVAQTGGRSDVVEALRTGVRLVSTQLFETERLGDAIAELDRKSDVALALAAVCGVAASAVRSYAEASDASVEDVWASAAHRLIMAAERADDGS